jgi:hypothetical protein
MYCLLSIEMNYFLLLSHLNSFEIKIEQLLKTLKYKSTKRSDRDSSC